jgi:urea-proton symporter
LSLAILFGLVLKFGNLALVLMDTAFWQKSFASEVSSTVPAYDIVSVVIIAVPWCTGTIIGLAARAIEKTPVWYTYPETLTLTQVNSGLVMPYVLRSLLGTGATTGLLVLVFMAITSTVSSSMIAVSSIISLDGYRTYINPRASDRRTLQVSHWGVVGHGIFMSGFAIMLEYAGATNNWSTYFRPIISCPGIFPMMLTILWSRQTKLAAILSPILGLISGLTVWLTLSWYWAGAINITTTQQQIPGLYAAIVSFFSPAVYSVVISLTIKPSQFDWREFLRIGLIEDKSAASSSENSNRVSLTAVDESAEAKIRDVDEKKLPELVDENATSSATSSTTNTSEKSLDEITHPFSEETLKTIKWWRKFAALFLILNISVTIVLWPLPLYRDWIFTKSFFNGWVTMAILWQWFALMVVVVFPIYDGRNAIQKSVLGMLKDGRVGRWKDGQA